MVAADGSLHAINGFQPQTTGSALTRRAVSIAQSTRLLLSSDLVVYCGSLVA